MLAVNLLLQNEKDLRLGWSHGCYYDGKMWHMGLQSVTGPMSPDLTDPVFEPRTEPPEFVMFSIYFLSACADELYNNLVNALSTNTPLVCIQKSSPLYKTTERRIKAEYQQQVDQMTVANEEKCERIRHLLEEAQNLGCSIEDYDLPQLYFPESFYETVEVEKRRFPSLTILCHRDTDIYQALKQSGLLEKYCPSEYSLGYPYCTGSGVWQRQPMISKGEQRPIVGPQGSQGCNPMPTNYQGVHGYAGMF